MKKIFLIATVLILALALSACSGTPAAEPAPAAPESAAPTEPAPAETPAELTKLTVGATPAPHAEILEFIKPALAEAGYELDIIIFTDYVLPNTALDAGELDANYFQHLPYLLTFNEENGTDLSSAAEIHFEPMGLFAGRSDLLIEDGAEIGIPSDTTNEARALQLLAAQGMITLKDGAGLEATPNDVADNPINLKFIESEAALLPRVLEDVDFAIINGNYAIDAGITDRILVTETSDSEGAQRFANVIAVKTGHENDPGIQALIKAITSDETRTFIEENYGGYVVPMF